MDAFPSHVIGGTTVPGRILPCAAATVVVVVAGACAGSAPTSAPPTTGAISSVAASAPASTSSAATGVAALYGSYTATIPSGVNAAPGDWSLDIATSGWTYTHPEGHRFTPGIVTELTANEVVLSPDRGCPVQAGTPTEGRYRWTLAGTSLKFDVISDSCQDRVDTLTSSVWARSP
jgi:hypothetical protein